MRSSIVISIVTLAAAGCGFRIAGTDGGGGHEATPGCDPTWYDGAWHARETITIDHTKVAGDLQDVPVLIPLSLAGAQPSGADILFTAADGRTRLSHELDTVSSTGVVNAWVRIPMLSASTDTILQVYFRNPAAAPQANPASVWAAGYSAVWHLGQDPAGTGPQMIDSSGHGLDATSRGAMVTADQRAGKIGGSLLFDGLDDGLDVPSTTLGSTFSYEAWIHKGVGTNWRCIIENWPSYDRWFGTTDSQLSFWDGGANIVNNTLTVDTWYHLVATYDASRVRIYRNGAPIGSPISKTYGPRTSTMQIGYTSTTIGEYFPGQLDEVRVSSVARSPEYIATSFRNQDAPSTFSAAGVVETCP